MDEMLKLDDRVARLESDLGRLTWESEKRNECFAMWIKKLDARSYFVGKVLCASLFLGVLAICMAVMF